MRLGICRKCLNYRITTPYMVDCSHRSPSGHSHYSRSSHIFLIARGKQCQESRQAMAKGKTLLPRAAFLLFLKVLDYFGLLWTTLSA